MRFIPAVVFASAIVISSSAAQAEKRVFIVGGNSDGYAIDQCLATGAHCGGAAATAFCRGREFKQAVSYRKVERDEVTGTVPGYGARCRGAACADFVAIECAR
jgi:hypothetical protein